jgi:hypothetical protein
MDIPARLRLAFPPDGTMLIQQLSRRLESQMLRDIAMADYGAGAHEAFEALCSIRDRRSTVG